MTQNVFLSEINYDDEESLSKLASLSYRASQKNSPTWLASISAARQEILSASSRYNKTRMVVEAGQPRGWISAQHHGYGSWEIHPLLVDPDSAGMGYGRMLVADIEALIRSNGGISVHLSTSDATHSTNLSGIDLYRDPITALKNINILDPQQGHAYQFWVRVGFTVVGVIPDAEGLDVPSIQLAKRL